MALKSWFEDMGASDCISGHTTWNDMVEYIKHSACTDFTIYSTCTDIGQAFKFTMSGIVSEMHGGANTGNDLKIFANSTNAYPYILLEGDSDISLFSSNDIVFYEDANERFKFYDGKSIDFLGDRAIHIDDDETYIGHGAGDGVTGANNTSIGHDALHGACTGGNNLAFGAECLLVNTAGIKNVAIGFRVLKTNLTGNSNIAIGYLAMQNADTANNNIGLGYVALNNVTGNNNIGLGYYSLGTLTTGIGNVAIGYNAGANVGAGIKNSVLLGFEAGKNNTQDNIVTVGYRALLNNTGTGNVALGFEALTLNTTGTSNIGLGYKALWKNVSGINNVAIGLYALRESTCSNNTAVGFQAGYSGVTHTGCVYLGHTAGFNNNVDNKLYINNSNSAFPLIYGEFNTDTINFGDNSADWFMQFDKNGNDSRIAGSTCTDTRLLIYQTSHTNYTNSSFIEFATDHSIYLSVNPGGTFGINVSADRRFTVEADGAGSKISGSNDNGDALQIAANSGDGNGDIYLNTGTGKVKFGTYAAKGAEAFSGIITMKDNGGTLRKMMICA